MKSLRCVFVIACALGVGPPTASAQNVVPSDGGNSDQVEQLGFSTQYKVANMPAGTASYTVTEWLGRQKDSVVYQDFATNTDGGRYAFTTPGTYAIRAMVKRTYFNADLGRMDSIGPYSVDRDVEIKPPSVFKIIGPGLRTTCAPPGSICPPPYDAQVTGTGTGESSIGGIPGRWCYFVLRSNDKVIGDAAFEPQENITRFYYGTTPQDNSNWRPYDRKAKKAADQGADVNFKLTRFDGDMVIADFKCVKPVDPTYNGYVTLYNQEVRVKWFDNTNQPVLGAALGAKRWQCNANGDNTWTATTTDVDANSPPPAP